MANITSSKQRVRETARRTEINRNRRSRIRSFLKKVETAIGDGNKDEAAEAFKLAQPELMRGVTKGIIHRNTASRKLSRLSARIKVL